MSQNRPGGVFSGLRMGGGSPSFKTAASLWSSVSSTCADISTTEVVREKVQDGLTGETRDIQYTQCKIVGNGSFGVVFQTKLSPSGEDAAIKRVLQDKRFKVYTSHSSCVVPLLTWRRIGSCKSCGSSDTRTSSNSRRSTTRTASGWVSPSTQDVVEYTNIYSSIER